jgi:cell division protein FtsZ
LISFTPKAAEVKEVQQPKTVERQEQTTFSLIYLHKPEPVQKVEEIKYSLN